eukprot:gene54301-25765_t
MPAVSDVWSLGIMTCELCTGVNPWGDVGNILAFMIKLGKEEHALVPTIPTKMPPDAQDFAQKCIKRDAEKRPTRPLPPNRSVWGGRELAPVIDGAARRSSMPFIRRSLGGHD